MMNLSSQDKIYGVKTSGISLTVNPTYDSSAIQVSLLAIEFSQ